MAVLKTQMNDGDVHAFLRSVENEQKRKDCFTLLEIMSEITDLPPKMWGDSIIGFGTYHYRYKTGREGDWFLVGFSPRKQNLTIYIMSGFAKLDVLLQQLGKYRNSVSCLYIKKLADVDQNILKTLIANSVEIVSKRYD